MKANLTFWLYIAISAIHITALSVDSDELIRFTEPLLMPLLMYYVYALSKSKVTARILLLSLALLFSWGGDLALMNEGQLYFMIGMGLFFATQVTYIILLSISTFRPLRFDPLKVLPFATYAVLLFYFSLPKAGNLMVPIFIYGIVIAVMAATARLREDKTTRESFRIALAGSIFFVLSGSILVIDKFSMEIPLAEPLIKGTYVLAQYLLVNGLLAHVD